MTKEEKKEKIRKETREYYNRACKSGVYYSDIEASHKSNLLKFDANLFFDDFISIYDTSFNSNCKDGIVFMLSGFYIPDSDFSGRTFIAYRDVVTMELERFMGKNLKITVSAGESYSVSSTYFEWQSLKELVQKLIEIDAQCDTSYTSGSPTGKVKGLRGGARYREGYSDGQVNGYQRCSREYEIKLRRQAELFLEEKNKWKAVRQEYEALLDEYEATIKDLEKKVAELEMSGSSKYTEYKNRLYNMVTLQNKLKNLKYA